MYVVYGTFKYSTHFEAVICLSKSCLKPIRLPSMFLFLPLLASKMGAASHNNKKGCVIYISNMYKCFLVKVGLYTIAMACRSKVFFLSSKHHFQSDKGSRLFLLPNQAKAQFFGLNLAGSDFFQLSWFYLTFEFEPRNIHA